MTIFNKKIVLNLLRTTILEHKRIGLCCSDIHKAKVRLLRVLINDAHGLRRNIGMHYIRCTWQLKCCNSYNTLTLLKLTSSQFDANWAFFHFILIYHVGLFHLEDFRGVSSGPPLDTPLLGAVSQSLLLSLGWKEHDATTLYYSNYFSFIFNINSTNFVYGRPTLTPSITSGINKLYSFPTKIHGDNVIKNKIIKKLCLLFALHHIN